MRRPPGRWTAAALLALLAGGCSNPPRRDDNVSRGGARDLERLAVAAKEKLDLTPTLDEGQKFKRSTVSQTELVAAGAPVAMTSLARTTRRRHEEYEQENLKLDRLVPLKARRTYSRSRLHGVFVYGDGNTRRMTGATLLDGKTLILERTKEGLVAVRTHGIQPSDSDRERLLLESPVLPAFFPGRRVAVGEKWLVPAAALAALFESSPAGVRHRGTVRARLAGKVLLRGRPCARIDLEAQVRIVREAERDGVKFRNTYDMQLTGMILFDLGTKKPRRAVMSGPVRVKYLPLVTGDAPLPPGDMRMVAADWQGNTRIEIDLTF